MKKTGTLATVVLAAWSSLALAYSQDSNNLNYQTSRQETSEKFYLFPEHRSNRRINFFKDEDIPSIELNGKYQVAYLDKYKIKVLEKLVVDKEFVNDLVLYQNQQQQHNVQNDVWDKEFTIWVILLYVSSVYDLETTFIAIGNGAKELNPIMKPFVNMGRLPSYGLVLGLDTLVTYKMYKEKEKGNSWRLPFIIGTIAHSVAGTLNLRFLF